MRRVLAVAVAVMVLTAGSMALSGCSFEVGLDTTVKGDGSGTVAVRLAADRELQDALVGVGGGLGHLPDILGNIEEKIPDDVEALFKLVLGKIPTGWGVDRGMDDEGAMWISLSHPFANPDELQKLLSDSVLSSFADADKFHLTQDKGFFRTKTVFSSTADMSTVIERAQEAEPRLGVELLGQILSIENRLTLPGTIKDSNADDMRGSTLTWHLKLSGNQEMYAESVAYNWGTIIAVAAAALVGLALLVILVVLLVRHRRRKDRRRHRRARVAEAEKAEAEKAETEKPAVTTTVAVATGDQAQAAAATVTPAAPQLAGPPGPEAPGER
jgi:hypothetical protein